MPGILFTLSWMTFNSLLAVLPVLLALLITQIKNNIVRIPLLIIWLLFLPNSVYLFSDLIHVPRSLARVSGVFDGVIILMFVLLMLIGIVTYLYSIYPLERVYTKFKKYRVAILFGLNVLVALGLILGRVFRFNSWEVIHRFPDIVMTTVMIIMTPAYILFITSFAIAATVAYIKITDTFLKSAPPKRRKK